jgi:hypothetical protein
MGQNLTNMRFQALMFCQPLKLIDILLKSVSFYEINVNTDISSAEMTSERIINYEIK